MEKLVILLTITNVVNLISLWLVNEKVRVLEVVLLNLLGLTMNMED